MVQLTLPRGSKPKTGKVHKAAPGSKDVKTYKVYRYDPETDADPRWDTSVSYTHLTLPTILLV